MSDNNKKIKTISKTAIFVTAFIAVCVIAAGCVAGYFLLRDKTDDGLPKTKTLLSTGSDNYLQTVILSDIRFDGSTNDANREAMIRRMINHNTPEFIILNGNTVDRADNGAGWRSVGAFMETLDLPWTVTLGVKDVTGDTDLEAVSAILQSFEHCYYRSGGYNFGIGSATYALPVVTSQGEGVTALFFFDTTTDITEKQTDWYRSALSSISDRYSDVIGKNIRSQILMNKPIAAFKEAGELVGNDSDAYILGYKREEVTVPATESGLFAAVRELKSTNAIFAGYDTKNDYQVMLNGVRMVACNSMYLKDGVSVNDYTGASIAFFQSGETLSVTRMLYNSIPKE